MQVLEERIILVDHQDNEVGMMEKMEAHLTGVLHRAFSVFIFNTKGELLMQQRELHKYHSGGKWSNTCCSHPRLGEDTSDAANRRLKEEMGMECHLQYAFNFTYQTIIQDNIIEYEFDHVYFGVSDQLPTIAAGEVAAFKYMPMDELANELKEHPDHYTKWLGICFDKVKTHYFQEFLRQD